MLSRTSDSFMRRQRGKSGSLRQVRHFTGNFLDLYQLFFLRIFATSRETFPVHCSSGGDRTKRNYFLLLFLLTILFVLFLFTAHYSLFTIITAFSVHCSLLTAFSAHCSLLTALFFSSFFMTITAAESKAKPSIKTRIPPLLCKGPARILGVR